MKAVVAAFNQEKALVGAFSVLTNLRMELFQALVVILAFYFITLLHTVQAGRGGGGLPAVGGRLLGQRQRLPLRSQRVQVLHH